MTFRIAFVLFYMQHESFQVFAFGMVDVDRMVCGLVQLVKNPYMSSTLCRCGEDRKPELVFADGLRAAEGEEYSSRSYLFESLCIEPGVTFQRIA